MDPTVSLEDLERVSETRIKVKLSSYDSNPILNPAPTSRQFRPQAVTHSPTAFPPAGFGGHGRDQRDLQSHAETAGVQWPLHAARGDECR